jgi:hypothetical protein
MSNLYIYFHKDFDGFVATALFLRISEESHLLGADNIVLKPVNYELKKTWLKTSLERPNVVIDFLYHPKADWWFDHHVSTFLNPNHKNKHHNSEKKFWDINQPSCAALIKQSLSNACSLFFTKDEYDKIVDSFREWIYWSDIIDNAKYESPAQVIELTHPCLQINETITSDIDDGYLYHLVMAAKMYSPAEVIQSQIVKTKVDNVLKMQKKYLLAFKDGYHKIHEKVIFYDYVKHGIPFQRYMTYYFEPDAKYSVAVYNRSGAYAISVGKNPWMDFSSKNIGEICNSFGGGGRVNVGSILVTDYKKALSITNEIFMLLNK